MLRADPHICEVARGTLLAFALKIGGSGLSFAFNVAVTRLLGAEGAGLFFLALAVTTIGSVIGRVGLDNALLRFVATRATQKDWSGVKGVYALSMRMAVVASGVIMFVAFLVAPWMATVLFKKPELAEMLRWTSLSILPFALLNLQAESLKGLKRIGDAMTVQGIGVPFVSLLLIYPLTQAAGVTGVAWSYAVATIMMALLGGWAWHRTMAVYEVEQVPFPLQELWASCRPLFVVSIMNNAVRTWGPLLILGIWAPSEEVGIFGASLRVVALTTMMLFTLNNVLAPKFAELYEKKEMTILASTARRSAMFLIVLSSPLFFILIFFPNWVMSMFGKGFREGGLILAILAMGQVVNVYAGTLGSILIVSGNEHYTQNMTLIFSGVLVTMLFSLVPAFGALGAAISIAVSGIGLSLVTAWQAEKIIGLRVIPDFRFAISRIFKKWKK
ncbi:MAG: oligosaccharide flippase family protein [Deltaproteobacteria bacterium]